MTTIRTATLRHGGEMRFEATTGTGRHPVFGDAAGDEELSPVEIVVAALAACSAMDVVSIALKKRQDFTRYEIRVRAEQRDEYPQVLHPGRGRPRGRGTRGQRDGHPALHRAVGHEVLPGQRDDLGRRDRGPSRLPGHRDRPRAVRRDRRGHRDRPVPATGRAARLRSGGSGDATPPPRSLA